MGLLKKFGEVAIMVAPIYGDIKIHKFLSKDRRESKKKIQKIKSIENECNEREINFRRELSDLLKKYDIKEERGSQVSYPSNYVASEKSNLGDLSCRSTLIPELVIYLAKYAVLFEAVYLFK